MLYYCDSSLSISSDAFVLPDHSSDFHRQENKIYILEYQNLSSNSSKYKEF